LIWHHQPPAARSIYKITRLLARPIGWNFKTSDYYNSSLLFSC
jgi:hypothetical protein